MADEGILAAFCNYHNLMYSVDTDEGNCPNCVKEDIHTICGCTNVAISGSTNPCFICGHANNHHMGKGCRVSFSPKNKGFQLESPDADYSKLKRIFA